MLRSECVVLKSAHDATVGVTCFSYVLYLPIHCSSAKQGNFLVPADHLGRVPSPNSVVMSAIVHHMGSRVNVEALAGSIAANTQWQRLAGLHVAVDALLDRDKIRGEGVRVVAQSSGVLGTARADDNY